MKKLLLSALALTLLSGCAASRDEYGVKDSDRKKGFVNISAPASLFSGFDNENGLAKSKQICESWGYKSSIAYGSEQKFCEVYGDKGCVAGYNTRVYQCI